MATRELSSSPSMRSLYPKAVGGAVLPLVRKLPGVGGAPAELPDEELVLRDAEIDARAPGRVLPRVQASSSAT